MTLLVLGGTVFAGRAVVEEALARGWNVTIFHRGRHGAGTFGDSVERILGDRESDEQLAQLAGRRFDLVVDTSGFSARTVRASTRRLADACERYVFVSSASVYQGWPAHRVSEARRVFDDPGEGDGHYGEGKAAAERAAESILPGRVVHARAGLLVGPHENIGRLPFWLRRVARGGEILAPGRPHAPLQWVDVRDHAVFLLAAPPGTYNVASPPESFTMAAMLEACRAVTGADASFVWVRDDALLEAELQPWSDVQMWVPDRPEFAAMYAVDTSRAMAAGLRIRSLEETVRDTWSWMQSDPGSGDIDGYRAEYRARDLDPAREAALLSRAR